MIYTAYYDSIFMIKYVTPDLKSKSQINDELYGLKKIGIDSTNSKLITFKNFIKLKREY